VHGACVAGGCMLAWVCDLIVASEDAFFADPVVRMGIPGVEYFAHPYELNPRIAKEFLFLGERMSSSRAYEMGMVNKVVPIENLESAVMDMAKKISSMPRLGLTLTKQAINHVEDLQGKRNGMEAAFAWHHFSHAHNDLTTGNVLSGFDAKKMAKSQRTKTKKSSPKKLTAKKPAPKKKKK
jgi:enoyl-CoA hydratase